MCMCVHGVRVSMRCICVYMHVCVCRCDGGSRCVYICVLMYGRGGGVYTRVSGDMYICVCLV